MTPTGPGTVVDCNIIKETVLVELETGVQVELPLKEVQVEGAPIQPVEKKNVEVSLIMKPAVEVIPPEGEETEEEEGKEEKEQ